MRPANDHQGLCPRKAAELDGVGLPRRVPELFICISLTTLPLQRMTKVGQPKDGNILSFSFS